ncbi:hypothetical protein Gpo141_00006366 [Globisporangium polare]
MKPSTLLFALAALASSLSTMVPTTTAYTNPIMIKGYKMFDAKTGAYFSAKGIDYYPRPNTGELNVNNVDFFTDDHYDIWSKDIEFLAGAGANSIRLYAVDPSKSHDKFMCALRSYGIYVLVDLGASCEGCGISKDKYPACYSSTLKTRGEQIITAFAKYDNVLGFSAGNEINYVVTDATTNAPCQKKFIKDMRAFIGGCSSTMRQIPVGVVLADHSRKENALYYNCRTDASDKYENAEWYGLNVYQYCDASVTEMKSAAGFMNLVSDFTSYKTSIPVMLTEFGCLNPSFPTVSGYDAQRTWLQAGWLHTPTFRKIFSGGFVFEFSTENANSKGDGTATATNGNSLYPFTKYGAQNYGLGYYSPENCDHSTTKCTFNPMPNYKSLTTQYTAVNTSDEPLIGAFTPDSDRKMPPQCPAGFAKLKDVKWPTDALKSAACPAAPATFTCPNQKSSGVWVGRAGSSDDSSATTPSPNMNDNGSGSRSSKSGGDDETSSTPAPTVESDGTTTAPVSASNKTNSTINSTASSAAGVSSVHRTLATSVLAIGLSTVAAALFL